MTYEDKVHAAYRCIGLNTQVLRELQARHDRFGLPQPLTLSHWGTVLGEEYGEVCRAIREGDTEGLKTELIQIAAVALNIILHLEHFGNSPDFLDGKVMGGRFNEIE